MAGVSVTAVELKQDEECLKDVAEGNYQIVFYLGRELFVKKLPTVDKIKWKSEYCHGRCKQVSYS